jgi:hypothetical protein
VLAIAAVGAVASAQPTVTATAPAPDGQVGFQRRAQLTPAQQVAQTELVVAQMKSSSGTTQRMLAQARLARDVVKTLCLNDKLSQIDVAGKTASERLIALKAAAARGDQEGSNHQFIILTVLKQRNDQLVAEANQCIGEENAFLGATNIVTTVDNTLPDTPVTDPPTDVTPVSVTPVNGSSGI